MRIRDVMERPASVPASLYTRAYYLTECGGHEEFAASRGETLPRRLALALGLVPLGPGVRVLDLGAGRGEAARFAARRGASAWGLDYSLDAVALQKEQGGKAVLASLLSVPAPSASFDVVLMLDVVEHLHPHELERALAEARRLLRPQGRLIVHTSPSTWYYRFGYPLYRAFMGLRGVRLPRDPRDRLPVSHAMHVNEQSPPRLRRALTAAGFRSRVFLASTDDYAREKNSLVRLVMRVAAGAAPLKYVFGNDIFAVAWKAAP